MAALDRQTLYVLQANGRVSRGNYTTGWVWDRNVDCGLNAAHTIAVHDDSVLVGAALGQSLPMTYSSDGGRTWERVIKQTPSNGNRHVAFDANFGKNSIVYVADDAGGIYRWALGRSNYWDDLEPPNNSFYGIAVGSGGAAYGAYNTNQTGVDRALYPGVASPSREFIGIPWRWTVVSGLLSSLTRSLFQKSRCGRSMTVITSHQ